MHKSAKTWNLILRSLQESTPVVLLYVLESTGSSPGRQGFFMAVNANGEMEGSIGGGIMEHKFVEMARERLTAISNKSLASYVRKQVHDKKAGQDQSGMICSGEQTIWIYPVRETDLEDIRELVNSLEGNYNGGLSLSPGGIRFDKAFPPENFILEFNNEQEWTLKEKTGYKNQLTIIGGGHCSLALSRIFAEMDFYIRVYDDRSNLKTMNENSSAHEKHILNDFTGLKDLIHNGRDHYVVIMTFGYRTDDLALRALEGKSFKYLGLLGSQHKIHKMMDEYRHEGISESHLQRVHAPIGLPIKSQTPEEIAISIAAEIIRVKNESL